MKPQQRRRMKTNLSCSWKMKETACGKRILWIKRPLSVFAPVSVTRAMGFWPDAPTDWTTLVPANRVAILPLVLRS